MGDAGECGAQGATGGAGALPQAELRLQLHAMERWLEQDKERREVLLIIKRSLNGLSSEYSFQREDGLRELLRLLRELQGTQQAGNWDDPALLRSEGRTDSGDLGSDATVTVTERILRQVFPKTPPPGTQHILCATSAAERRLAMACLEGLAVLSRREQKAFRACRGIVTVRDELDRHMDAIRPLRDPDLRRAQQEHMQSAAREAVPLLCAALDALLAACLDSPAAQGQVMDLDLPRKLCHVLVNRSADTDLRYKIVEFLSVLLRLCELGVHNTPDSARGPRGDQQPAGERLVQVLRQGLGADSFRRLPGCVTLWAQPLGTKGAPLASSAKRDLLQQAEFLESLPTSSP